MVLMKILVILVSISDNLVKYFNSYSFKWIPFAFFIFKQEKSRFKNPGKFSDKLCTYAIIFNQCSDAIFIAKIIFLEIWLDLIMSIPKINLKREKIFKLI